MALTGIILAGGKSTRMGTDKALLKIEGETLLKRAVKFCQSFCDEILVSSNNPEHKVEDLRLITDEIEDCGPIGGIYSCLKQSKSDWNFVMSVDAVFVEKDFILQMMNETENYEAVVPYHIKGKEPLVAFYHGKIATIMFQQVQKKNFRITDLLELVNTKWLNAQKWIDNNPRIFFNLNRQEDLEGIK